MKKLFLTAFSFLFLQAYADENRNWQWVRITNMRGDLVIHLSKKALQSTHQEKTLRLFSSALHWQDLDDIRNHRLPKRYIGCTLTYGCDVSENDNTVSYCESDSSDDE